MFGSSREIMESKIKSELTGFYLNYCNERPEKFGKFWKVFSPSIMMGRDSIVGDILEAEVEFYTVQKYKFKAFCKKKKITRDDASDFVISLSNLDDNFTSRSILLVILVAILILGWKAANLMSEGVPFLHAGVSIVFSIFILSQLIERINYNDRAKAATQLARVIEVSLNDIPEKYN